jgi:hypothetical protein
VKKEKGREGERKDKEGRMALWVRPWAYFPKQGEELPKARRGVNNIQGLFCTTFSL